MFIYLKILEILAMPKTHTPDMRETQFQFNSLQYSINTWTNQNEICLEFDNYCAIDKRIQDVSIHIQIHKRNCVK